MNTFCQTDDRASTRRRSAAKNVVPHQTHSRCDGDHMELESSRFRQECPGAALVLHVAGAAVCACLRGAEAALRVRCRTDFSPCESHSSNEYGVEWRSQGRRPVDMQTSVPAKNKRMKRLEDRFRRAEESGTAAPPEYPTMRGQDLQIGDIQ